MAKNKQQIKFEADIAGFKSAIKEGEVSIKSLNKELKLNKEQLKGNNDNVDLLTTRVKTLKQQYEEQTKVIENSRASYEKAVELFGENSEEARKWKDNIVEAEAKQQKIKNAIDETNKKIKEQTSGWIDNGKALQEAGSILEKIGDKMNKVGNVLSVAGAGVAGGLIATKKATIEYESAFTGVEKTVDATEEQLKELSDGILEMSTRMPAAATEIAGVAESAGQLGIETEDVLSFTEVMINLGEATNLSADEVASSLAKFANITNMSADNYERLGSVIVDLGNNFATTEADIVEMATRLAATGELTGLTESQIMALATAMSSVGIEAEAGGSAMSKLLKKIQVACETGNKDLKQFAKVSGKSAKDFKDAFQKDAVGALSEFLAGLNDTKRNGKSAIAILQDMDLTEVRLSNTILSLSNASGVLNDAVGTANDAWNKNTALQTEVDKRYNTTESQMKMLKNEVTKLAIEFGNELAPTLRDLIKDVKPLLNTVSDAIKKFSNLDDKTKQNTIKILALTVAVGPLVKTVGNLTSGVGKAFTAVGKLSENFGKAKANASSATESFKTSSSSLSTTVSAITITATALATATALIKEKVKAETQEVRNFITELNNSVEARKESFNAINEQQNASLAEIENTKILSEELNTLVDENGRVKEGYEERAGFIVGQLKDSLGIEIDYTDGVIARYDKLKETIDEVILKKEAEIILEAQSQKYQEAITNKTKAYEDYLETQKNLKEVEEQLEEAEGTLAEVLTQGSVKAYKQQQTIKELKAQQESLTSSLGTQGEQLQKYSTAIEQYETNSARAIEGGADNLKLIQESITQTEKTITQNINDELDKRMKDQLNAVKQSKELYELEEQYNKNAKDSIYAKNVETSQNNLRNLADELLATTSTVTEMTESQKRAWFLLAKGSIDTYASVLSNLDDETVYKIQDATGRVISDEQLAEAFKGLGRESIEGFKENNFEQAGTDAAENIKTGLESQKNSVATAGNVLGGSFISAFSSIIGSLHTAGIQAVVNSSNADGLAYVPYNGYVARLHEGERILTKKENADYIRNNTGNGSNSITVNFYPQQMTDAEIDRASRYINRKWGVRV